MKESRFNIKKTQPIELTIRLQDCLGVNPKDENARNILLSLIKEQIKSLNELRPQILISMPVTVEYQNTQYSIKLDHNIAIHKERPKHKTHKNEYICDFIYEIQDKSHADVTRVYLENDEEFGEYLKSANRRDKNMDGKLSNELIAKYFSNHIKAQNAFKYEKEFENLNVKTLVTDSNAKTPVINYIIKRKFDGDLLKYIEKSFHEKMKKDITNYSDILNKPEIQKEVFSIIRKLLVMLKTLHEQKIIHHDIKPDNILFDSEMNVVATDFDNSGEHDSKGLGGTLTYMTKNNLYLFFADRSSEITLSQSDDIYSAGITILTLLTGMVPFIIDLNKEYSNKEKEEFIYKATTYPLLSITSLIKKLNIFKGDNELKELFENVLYGMTCSIEKGRFTATKALNTFDEFYDKYIQICEHGSTYCIK